MRRDVFINCAAPVFAVSARDLSGHDRSVVAADLPRAVDARLVVPLRLLDPAPFVVRVIEDALREDEAAQWVGHVSGSLACPEGVLHLEGGFGPLPDLTSLRALRVPSGLLRVDLYTYLGGSSNGTACHARVGGGVPLGRWFRASRPGEEFPDWLALQCMEWPGLDPGFEADWQELAGSRTLDRTRSRLKARPPLAFALQLRPLSTARPPPPREDQGLIAPDTGARLPDFCPRGLDATVALQEESDDTDLPIQTEQPDAVALDVGDAPPSFWSRVRRWAGRDD